MTMATPRALLRCAALSLAVALTHAFAPSTPSRHPPISLSAAPCDRGDAARLPRPSPSDAGRRSFLGDLVAATSALVITGAPPAALAEEEEAPRSKVRPLSSCLYSVLRAREATEQESRLISSGKFKDVQRANVKLAIKFIINNYRLSDSIIAASSYLGGNARVRASGVGQSAVQSLYTIVEYFDASDVENIKVSSLAGKEAIVNNGLASARRDIDEFLSLFPKDVVEEQRAKIMEENELNYKEFDSSLGTILNQNPKPTPVSAPVEAPIPAAPPAEGEGSASSTL